MRLIEDIGLAYLIAWRENVNRRVVDCGHIAQPDYWPVPDWEKYADTPGGGMSGTLGFGTDPETGRTACFDCCHKADVERMRTADKFFAYLSADHGEIHNWPGWKLGRVTSYTTSKAARRCYVRVTDVHGGKWYGTGPMENGTYVSLRRVKSKG